MNRPDKSKCRLAMSIASRGFAELIGDELGTSNAFVSSWGQENNHERRCPAYDIAVTLHVLVREGQLQRALDLLAAVCAGLPLQVSVKGSPESLRGVKLKSRALNTITEALEAVQAISESSEDGVVDAEERERLLKEIPEALERLEGFRQDLEREPETIPVYTLKAGGK